MDTKELVGLVYELLEALEELVEDNSKEAHDKARLVIAEARGKVNHDG